MFSKKTLTLFGRRGALQRDFKRVDQRGALVRGVCPFWCVCVQKNILNKKLLYFWDPESFVAELNPHQKIKGMISLHLQASVKLFERRC